MLTLWGRTRAGKGIMVAVWPTPGHTLDAWIVNPRPLNNTEPTELAHWEESQ